MSILEAWITPFVKSIALVLKLSLIHISIDATYLDTNLTISHYSDRFDTPLIDKSLEIGSSSADDVPYVILKILPSETADLNGLCLLYTSRCV